MDPERLLETTLPPCVVGGPSVACGGHSGRGGAHRLPRACARLLPPGVDQPLRTNCPVQVPDPLCSRKHGLRNQEPSQELVADEWLMLPGQGLFLSLSAPLASADHVVQTPLLGAPSPVLVRTQDTAGEEQTFSAARASCGPVLALSALLSPPSAPDPFHSSLSPRASSQH